MNDKIRVGLRRRFFGPGMIRIVLVDDKQAVV